MNYDFHIHTTFSDGTLTPEDIVGISSNKGLAKIGITDHWGTRKYSDRFQVTDIKSYIEALRSLKRDKGIEVYMGLEIDFSYNYGADPGIYPYDLFNELDFLLFEYVDSDEKKGDLVNGRSLDELIQIRKNLKIPAGLAHNHFQRHYAGEETSTIKKLKDNDIFLELCEAEDSGNKVVDNRIFLQMLEIKKNVKTPSDMSQELNKIKEKKTGNVSKKKHSESDKYYFELFSEDVWNLIQKYNLTISVSSDSHKGLELGKNEALKPYLHKYNLEKQILFGC